METKSKAIEEAERFVSWFRSMNIEGQIVCTPYALSKLKEACDSDYDLVTSLRKELSRAEGR